MAITNLSLGNLYRAATGVSRTTQAVSINAMNASLGTSVSFGGFAINSVTVNLPTYTYIVESTTETATFTFGSPGAVHGARVGSVAANYSVTFDNSNFTVGTPTLGASPSFPITPAGISQTTYSEASSVLTMKYADGYNINATNYNVASTKTLYAVDVYNTINQPDFCLLFGTKVQKSDGTIIPVEDLQIGDSIKAWQPTGLPDENAYYDQYSHEIDWHFYALDVNGGDAVNVVVTDLVFNFASTYYSINNGMIKSTGTHPLWVWDSQIQKYTFKLVEDIINGDKLIKYDDVNGLTEIVVNRVEVIQSDVEIVTINVEETDTFLSNGLISHNKGTTTQPSIPSSGLVMYLDPSKAYSYPSQTLPSTGNPSVDWLDLTGYGTGFRPTAQAPRSSGTNPYYNAGATRKEKYYDLNGSDMCFFKDRISNINGGISNFDVTALSFFAWVRLSANPNTMYGGLFSKEGADRDYNFYIYSSTSTAWNGFHFSSARGTVSNGVQTFTAPSLNVWYMVGFTISAAAGITYYLDNTSMGTGTMSSFTATSSYDMKLGAADNFAKCNLGPVLFYNRVLSGTEVTRLYNYFSPTYK